MRTSRRLLLIVLGFAGVFAAYQTYLYFFGQYDGLRPLPSEHFPVQSGVRPPPPQPGGPRPGVAKLQLAFGPNCEEQHRQYIIEWRPQGIVLAADQFKILEDTGRLQLNKVSIALFGKQRPGQTELKKDAEINTVRAEQAEIEFDQPLTNPKDATHRKPVGGRLQGNVQVTNNRHTPIPADSDDLRLYTDWLAYQDHEHRLWTDAPVRIVDGTPENALINAIGMEVILIPGEETERAPASRKYKPSIDGVKTLKLKSDVRMDLLVDAKGFLESGPQTEPGPDQPVTSQPAKTPVVVNSSGPFVYDVPAERAEFQEKVSVIRGQKSTGTPTARAGPGAPNRYDQLDCDRLVMQFRRKAEDGKDPGNDARRPANDGRSMELELLNAHATGKEVRLVSDAEQPLEAVGNDLFYDAATKNSILKGDPLVAEQNGNEIRAHSLTMKGTGQKDFQEAQSQGPGTITMRGRNDQAPVTVRWQNELRSSRDGQLDKLVFTGKVFFDDPERGQLRADQLVAWLETIEMKEGGGVRKRRVPKKVEASGNITTSSPKLFIRQADRLWMYFDDVKTAANPPAPATGGIASRPGEKPSPVRPMTGTAANNALPPKAAPQKQEQPIELWARSVEVWLLRDGNKTDLQRLHTEGQVHVKQQALAAEDKAVEIKGDRLELTHHADGDKLQVTGQSEPAYVQLDKLYIVGPIVNIDQQENFVEVKGLGSLKMPSDSDFEGRKLKEPVDLIVHWKDAMFFQGRVAEFAGGVQAVQGNARLSCHALQVELDQPVSLKEGSPGQKAKPATLNRLLCDGDREGNGLREVHMVQDVRDGDKWREFTSVTGAELSFDNPSSELIVYGPGTVRMFQPGSKQNGLLEPSSSRAVDPKEPKEEMKLTEVTYLKKMIARRIVLDKTTTRHATFLGQVEVTHVPAERPDVAINPDKPVRGLLWMRCGKLEVQSTDGKENDRVFTASDRVEVRAERFVAQADLVKHDESLDRLIFEGLGGNKAILWHQKQPGGKPDEIRARQIWYWRKTNTFQTKDTDGINASP